jgi:hypothetical protein
LDGGELWLDSENAARYSSSELTSYSLISGL